MDHGADSYRRFLDGEEQRQYLGIYRRNEGTGEVYWDGQMINYSNPDFSRTVNIVVDKGCLPLSDYLFFETTEEKFVEVISSLIR